MEHYSCFVVNEYQRVFTDTEQESVKSDERRGKLGDELDAGENEK